MLPCAQKAELELDSSGQLKQSVPRRPSDIFQPSILRELVFSASGWFTPGEFQPSVSKFVIGEFAVGKIKEENAWRKVEMPSLDSLLSLEKSSISSNAHESFTGLYYF